jgi:hypothetical protein
MWYSMHMSKDSMWRKNLKKNEKFLRTKALFSCENFLDFTTAALSFVFNKYYSIMY